MSEDKTANVEVTTSEKEPKSKKKEKTIKNVIDVNPKLEEAGLTRFKQFLEQKDDS